MPLVHDCHLPEHLAYDVPNHIWYEALDGGHVRLGMTAIAVALADRRIFAFTPKRVGREIEAGRSFATIESGKWVGPARAAFAGTVLEVNEALMDRPSLLADDPYAAWMIVAAPADPAWAAGLVAGTAIAGPYEAWMVENDFPGCGGAH